jgi:tRNA-dihydrouridine synthase
MWQGNAAPASPSVRERGRVMLQLVEDELRFFGKTVGLRRLPRTSCYFAGCLPNRSDFRAAVQQVRNVEQFRRLVKESFR